MKTEFLVWVVFTPSDDCHAYPAVGYGEDWVDRHFVPLAVVNSEAAADVVVGALDHRFGQDAERPEFWHNPAEDYIPEEWLLFKADVQHWHKLRHDPGYAHCCNMTGADGSIWAWVHRAQLLAEVADDSPAGSNGKRRGRPQDKFTKPRADHAKRRVEGEGWDWQEAFEDYRQEHPEDTDASLNIYRKAYERLHPAEMTRRNSP